MYSGQDDLAAGFPHSEIRGSKAARASPRLIATCYVLHRLSVPRHPPNALNSLDPKQPVSRPAASAHSALHNLDLTNHKSFITSTPRTQPRRRHAGTKFKSIQPRTPPDRSPEKPKAKRPRKTTCGQSMHPINNVKQQTHRPRPIGNSNARYLSRNPRLPRLRQIPASNPSIKSRHQIPAAPRHGGAERDRTDDLLLAKQALSQLSYSPKAISQSTARSIGGPGKI